MGLVYRTSAMLIAVITGAMVDVHSAIAVDPLNPSAPCSVLDSAPCTPSFCGVFDAWPCVPSLPSIGQGLRVTVTSRLAGRGIAPTGQVDSLRDLHWALRACWEPPPLKEAFHGMQISVRFSFKRTGQLFAPPRVTYTNSDADPDTRHSYRRAVEAAFERCTPMPFTDAMGGAIAGRPISIRFIDDRRRSND